MRRSTEFLLGLLDPDSPGYVAAEDVEGLHGGAVRAWQDAGFIAREPGMHPSPGCPHCADGVPYRLGERWLCASCRSTVEPEHLLAWAVDRASVIRALATHLRLTGGVRMIGDGFWQLGTGTVADGSVECFCLLGGVPPADAGRHLGRYVRLLVLHGQAADPEDKPGRWFPLVELLTEDGSLAARDLADLLAVRGAVGYDSETGALRVGGMIAGEVPVGSREALFLECLAGQLDRYVPYADLKREVLKRARGSAETEEATFCQKLKSRIKRKYVPGIDRLIVTSNKADGYRLRAVAEL
ncbi:MAG TPA: hypothetical protein VD866_26870 [Urbifossiella sp.]|nr:hypothetical protein [Urbifossiella sp.]